MAGRQFALERVLGDGSFGTVYLAELTSMGGFKKSVALKLLKPDWDAGSDAARRLRDEARLLGRLRHRHIVQVDDLIRLDGRWAVVMEYVPGVDLELLISPDNLDRVPPMAALEITAAIAQALDAAYNSAGEGGQLLQVVHRDIKPSNVRMTAAGDVKVLDFGIARAEFQGREAKTDNVRYGSLGYMSPERLLGDPEVPAGDVFAVGAVLYELLVGTPFGRVQLAPDRAVTQLADQLAAAAKVLPEEVHPALELIRACMAYEVEDRPGSDEVATRARAISRRLTGEDLFVYASRVVPAVQAKTAGRPIERRMLTEEIEGGGSASVSHDVSQALEAGLAASAPQRSAPTLAQTLTDPLPTETAENKSGGVALLVAGMMGLLVMLAAGGAGLYLVLQSEDAPADVDVPVVAAPAAAAAAAPAPAPAPAAAAAAAPAPAPVADEPVAGEAAGGQAAVTQVAAPATPASAPAASAKGKTASTAPADVEPAKAATPAPAPKPEATPAADAPPVDRVKFHVPGATLISATCSGVSNSSTTASLNVLGFPAGTCSIKATINGTNYKHSLQVLRPNGYTCTPSGERLTCTSQL